MTASTRENRKFIGPVGLVILGVASGFAVLEAVSPGAALKQVTLVLMFSAMGAGAVLSDTAGEPTSHDWRVHYMAAAILMLCALVLWFRGADAAGIVAIFAAILIARGIYRRRYRAHPGTGSPPQSTVG